MPNIPTEEEIDELIERSRDDKVTTANEALDISQERLKELSRLVRIHHAEADNVIEEVCLFLKDYKEEKLTMFEMGHCIFTAGITMGEDKARERVVMEMMKMALMGNHMGMQQQSCSHDKDNDDDDGVNMWE